MQLRRLGLRSIGSVMHSIATWEEAKNDRSVRQDRHESIATEPQQENSPGWTQSVDALLKAWTNPVNDGLVVSPSWHAIRAALEWVVFLRSEFPGRPPILIAREPSGGIVIERRWHSTDGSEVRSELTIYNNLTAEHTIYVNGRVSHMGETPSRPPRARNEN